MGSLWKDFGFGVDTPEEFVAKVFRLWEIAEGQVRYQGAPDDVLWIEWGNLHDGYGHYSAEFDSERRLRKIAVRLQPSPTLEQVIDCQGFPDYYFASWKQEVEARTLSVTAWYAKEGLIFGSYSTYYGLQPPIIRPGHLMNSQLLVVAPGPPERMVEALHLPGQEISEEEASQFVKPWPGSIEDMEIETDPQIE